MVKMNYVVISTGVSVDTASGNVTLFNMIDDVRIPKDRLPISIPELVFVGSFTRLDEKIEKVSFQLDFIQPNNKVIPINKGEAPFQNGKLRIIARLNGIPIEGFGRHKFRVSWSWGEQNDDTEGSFDVFLEAFPFDDKVN